ncbi:MAG TPA: hypothetical protein VD963_07665 [Phycisphaerales bacterium]|nr:hypothetical protein [Phycisphaerales bacterium]
MDFLTHLWLPILLSGVGVWIASALAWMAIGHHKKDREAIPSEREFMDTITRLNIRPGNYGFPDFCQHGKLSPEERKKAMKALYDTHPQGLLRVWAPTNMGANMLITFLFYLVTSAVIAYLGWAALPHGGSVALGAGPGITGAEGVRGVTGAGGAGNAMFWKVFQVLGTAGILAYCFASFPGDLWFQKKRRAMVMDWIDGIVFGLITGAIFAWLWPR